jgi:hypothetical protein
MWFSIQNSTFKIVVLAFLFARPSEAVVPRPSVFLSPFAHSLVPVFFRILLSFPVLRE